MAGLGESSWRGGGVSYLFWRGQWEVRRITGSISRRFGTFAFISAALVAVFIGLLVYRANQHRLEDALENQLIDSPPEIRSWQPEAGHDESRKRLSAFYNYLPLYEQIPDAIDSLLSIAAEQGLTLERGDYKPLADVDGKFIRYQIGFPVSGDAKAIQSFVALALIKHRSLALDSIQFKRDSIGSDFISAKIQWTLLVKPAVVRQAVALSSSATDHAQQ